MNKLKPWLLAVSSVLLVLTLLAYSVTAKADVAVTFFGNSVHPFSEGMNGEHELLGIEYLDTTEDYTVGYGISTFKNSYNIRSYMYTQTAYIHWDRFPLTTVLMAGVTTGYKNTATICIFETGVFCGVAGLGLQYDDLAIKPRVTLFGEAIVFSLSYTF